MLMPIRASADLYDTEARADPGGNGCPFMANDIPFYEAVNRQVPCDSLAMGLINLRKPQPDELLSSHGWPIDDLLAWCDEGFKDDTLLQTAKRRGVASVTPGEADKRNSLQTAGFTLTCMAPESLRKRRWWWCQMARKDRNFTAVERQVAHLLLRQRQVQFNYVPPPGLGHLLLGHDDRLIHVDPATQVRLLQNRGMLEQLIHSLHAVGAQRWPESTPDQSHDFGIELAGRLHWVCFSRGAAIDDARAMRWCVELRPLAAGELPAVGSVDDARIARAIAYLHDHYQESPSLTCVAEAVDVSPFHFHRLFTRHVGVSPKRYLQRKQLQDAKWLLRATRTPIGQIAASTGFSSHGHFTSTFRRLTTVSPTEYREGESGNAGR